MMMVKLLPLTISELGTWGHPQGFRLQVHKKESAIFFKKKRKKEKKRNSLEEV